MLDLNKITMITTPDDDRHVIECTARAEVTARGTIAEEMDSPAARSRMSKTLELTLWGQLYGGDLLDQANRVRRAYLLLPPSLPYQAHKDLKTEINALLAMLTYGG